MYLDTDILLAWLKEKDWLKPYVDFKKLRSPKTGAITIVEAQIVLMREIGRITAVDVAQKISEKGVQIQPLDAKVLARSAELLRDYPTLTIFDSLHAAFCLLNKETIYSTDGVFKKIKGLTCLDPRDQ